MSTKLVLSKWVCTLKIPLCNNGQVNSKSRFGYTNKQTKLESVAALTKELWIEQNRLWDILIQDLSWWLCAQWTKHYLLFWHPHTSCNRFVSSTVNLCCTTTSNPSPILKQVCADKKKNNNKNLTEKNPKVELCSYSNGYSNIVFSRLQHKYCIFTLKSHTFSPEWTERLILWSAKFQTL